MAEEDSDSGSSLVGPGLGGCGQSNKPKKVARRGGQGARGSQGGRGGRGWGVEAEGGDRAEELVDEWPWMGNIFITMKSISKYKYSYIY